MKSLAGLMVLAALAFAVGCSAKRLQADAGGPGGGSIGIDGGATGGGGPGGVTTAGAGGAGGGIGTGGAGGTLFTGRRSFVVTSTLDLGGNPAPTGAPTSHVFTMVVDGDMATAILGAGIQGFVSPIQPTAGGFRVTAPMTLPIPGAPAWFVYYTDLTFALDPTGLLNGSGSGQLTLNGGGGCNRNYNSAATMSLTGTPDTVAPVLTIASAGDLTDPFSSFGVVSTEPLPGQTARPVLRAASGDTVVLSPSFTPSDTFLTGFDKPAVVLRFGEQYSIDLTGMTDFAGNAAVAPTTDGLGFTTVAAPPLVAADGFESVTGATLGGAQVLSGAGDPVINGTHSLYVPSETPTTPTKTELALRLPVSPGKIVVRFAYRNVNLSSATNTYFAIGSVGGSIVIGLLPSDTGATTTGTIAGTQVLLGPLGTMTIDLPADVTDEIVLERVAQVVACPGFPASPTQGIIIDDLRIE
ncbi:MAG TPA: hypothetical protein VKQ32_22985 [Polyangia bacterium]|nr:hypothetical protein [Polyangia bacterium]